MEILPFLQNVNLTTSSSSKGNKNNSLSFRNFLSQNSAVNELSKENSLKNTSSEKISMEKIVNNINDIVKQLPHESISSESTSELNIDSITDENGEMSTTLYSISNEIAEVLSENLSIIELVGTIKNEPTIVNILSLVKVIENADIEFDVKPFLSDINNYLKNEFPSFKNVNFISLESILEGFAKMNSKDQMLLEGQVFLNKLISQGSNNIEVLNKFLMISETLKAQKNESMISNLLVKNNILAELSSISALSDRVELIKNLLDKSDFQTVKSLFINTVDGFIQNNKNSNSHLLNHFEQQDNFMSVDLKNQLKVENFASETREETFTIHLNYDSPGTTKTDISVRQEFTNQLLSAFKNSKFAQMPNGTNKLILKLNPEHLGLITVKLLQKNGEMVARLITSSQSAKELLDHSIHQLKQLLPSVQIEIERYEVFSEQPQKSLKEHSENRENSSSEHKQQHHDDEDNDEQSFVDSLIEALNTTV